MNIFIVILCLPFFLFGLKPILTRALFLFPSCYSAQYELFCFTKWKRFRKCSKCSYAECQNSFLWFYFFNGTKTLWSQLEMSPFGTYERSLKQKRNLIYDFDSEICEQLFGNLKMRPNPPTQCVCRQWQKTLRKMSKSLKLVRACKGNNASERMKFTQASTRRECFTIFDRVVSRAIKVLSFFFDKFARNYFSIQAVNAVEVTKRSNDSVRKIGKTSHLNSAGQRGSQIFYDKYLNWWTCS